MRPGFPRAGWRKTPGRLNPPLPVTFGQGSQPFGVICHLGVRADGPHGLTKSLEKGLNDIMEVIYSLIPGMLVMGIGMVGVLIWAIKRGQYDDLEGDGNRLLMDDDDPLLPTEMKKEPHRWPDAED